MSIFVNMYLMMQMTPRTWAQFGIWIVIGKWLSGDKGTLGWLTPALFLIPCPHIFSNAIIGDLPGIYKWGECPIFLLIVSFLY